MSDLIFETLTEADIELVRNWRNAEEVAKYMYTEAIISESDQKKWFSNIDWQRNHYWLIKYDDRKLGLASINGIDSVLQSCYWAFYLGDTSVRGAGIGAKVEYNVLQYVFNTLKLNKLRCEVFVHNDKVIKMHEKFGFRREAYYREHCIKRGEKLDVVGLALIQSEWQVLEPIMRKRIYGE